MFDDEPRQYDRQDECTMMENGKKEIPIAISELIKEVFFSVEDLDGTRGRGKLWEEVLRIQGVFLKCERLREEEDKRRGF